MSAGSGEDQQVKKPEQVVYETPDEVFEEQEITHTQPPNENIDTAASDFTDNYRKMRKLTFPSDYDNDIVVPLPDGATRTVFRSHMDTAPPHEKVLRLKEEINDLETKLKALASAGGKSDDLLSSVRAQDAAALEKSVSALGSRLSQVSSEPSYQPFLGEAKSSGGVSTALLQKIDTFQKVNSKATSKATTPSAGGASLTYELYCSKSQVDAGVKHSVNLIEQRIARLEQALGGSSSTSSHLETQQPALLHRLTALEDSVALLDDTKLKSVAEKMTQLTKEFDAFLLKRTKEGAKGNKFASANAQQQKLDTMFKTMQKWQDGADALPKVVARLQSLRVLHEESALFSRRLLALETAQSDLKDILAGDAAALQAVQKAIAANSIVVKDNIKAMDERLAKLEAAGSS